MSAGRSLYVAWLGALLLATPLTGRSEDHDHALWQVQGRENVIYLTGSVHLLPPDEPVFTAAIEQAYLRADALIMEVDLDDLDPAEAQAVTSELGILSGDRKLSEALGPELFDRVASRTLKLGIATDVLERFRPWLAGMTLTQLEMMRLGFAPEAGVEQRLLERALSDGKQVRGLETFAEQIGVLAGLSPELEREFVAYALEDIDGLKQELDGILDAWCRGDLDALSELTRQGFEEFPALYEPLIADRNRRWVAQLVELLDDADDYLVVVGALHLIGTDSVIDLLAQRGFEVERQ